MQRKIYSINIHNYYHQEGKRLVISEGLYQLKSMQ